MLVDVNRKPKKPQGILGMCLCVAKAGVDGWRGAGLAIASAVAAQVHTNP